MKRALIGIALALASRMVFAGVNINTADVNTLAKELAGVGVTKAQAIVKYRAEKGPFKSPEELKKVEGIGESTYERNKANIRIKD